MAEQAAPRSVHGGDDIMPRPQFRKDFKDQNIGGHDKNEIKRKLVTLIVRYVFTILFIYLVLDEIKTIVISFNIITI